MSSALPTVAPVPAPTVPLGDRPRAGRFAGGVTGLAVRAPVRVAEAEVEERSGDDDGDDAAAHGEAVAPFL